MREQAKGFCEQGHNLVRKIEVSDVDGGSCAVVYSTITQIKMPCMDHKMVAQWGKVLAAQV